MGVDPRIARNHARRLYAAAQRASVPEVAEHLREAAREQARLSRRAAVEACGVRYVAASWCKNDEVWAFEGFNACDDGEVARG